MITITPEMEAQAIARIVEELNDLTVEVFSTTYGADWRDAQRIALSQFADLIDYYDQIDEAYDLYPVSLLFTVPLGRA